MPSILDFIVTPSPKNPTVIDWDKALDNLRKMFEDLEKKDRNERDRARKKARGSIPSGGAKASPRRCERCKRFCKDKLCARCQSK